jgi:hypothetical protein
VLNWLTSNAPLLDAILKLSASERFTATLHALRNNTHLVHQTPLIVCFSMQDAEFVLSWSCFPGQINNYAK